jgi:hypothetical protein
MTSPRNATTTKSGRTYTWGDESFTSVTTLLGALSKTALVNWAAKMVAEYAVDNGPEILALAQADRDGAIRALKGSPWQKRDQAADLGTHVHDQIEARILGQTPATPPDDVATRVAYFETFCDDYQPTFEAAEATVYNRDASYAGTLDSIAIIGGERFIIDVKTTKSGVYPEHALQLAAYANSEFIGAPDGTEVPLPDITAGAVLWINPRGYELVRVRIDHVIYDSFLDIARAWEFQNIIGKSAILGQVEVPA